MIVDGGFMFDASGVDRFGFMGVHLSSPTVINRVFRVLDTVKSLISLTK